MGARVCIITADVPSFMLTKASQPTFVIDENNIHSNNKAVDNDNKGGNRDTTTTNNKKPTMTDFMK